jgi:hypothetical protein
MCGQDGSEALGFGIVMMGYVNQCIPGVSSECPEDARERAERSRGAADADGKYPALMVTGLGRICRLGVIVRHACV